MIKEEIKFDEKIKNIEDNYKNNKDNMMILKKKCSKFMFFFIPYW